MKNIIWAATNVTFSVNREYVYRGNERRFAIEDGVALYRNGFSDPLQVDEIDRWVDYLTAGE